MRVNHYHIIRVRGTPATGKSVLMELVFNKLLETYGNMIPIHTLVGQDRKAVKEVTGWKAYLQQETGVRGKLQGLLLDEAQVSYWDGELGPISSRGFNPSNILPYYGSKL